LRNYSVERRSTWNRFLGQETLRGRRSGKRVSHTCSIAVAPSLFIETSGIYLHKLAIVLRDIEKDNAHQDSLKQKESKPAETPKMEDAVESTPTPTPSSSTTTKPSKISRSSFY
jgi:hypothetical protein